MIWRLNYVSTAVDCHEGCVNTILETARYRNLKEHITGILMFDGERFLQVLEGSRTNVQQLMNVIREDTRHRDINVFYEGFEEQRYFPKWSMEFSALPPSAIVLTDAMKLKRLIKEQLK